MAMLHQATVKAITLFIFSHKFSHHIQKKIRQNTVACLIRTRDETETVATAVETVRNETFDLVDRLTGTDKATRWFRSWSRFVQLFHNFDSHEAACSTVCCLALSGIWHMFIFEKWRKMLGGFFAPPLHLCRMPPSAMHIVWQTPAQYNCFA